MKVKKYLKKYPILKQFYNGRIKLIDLEREKPPLEGYFTSEELLFYNEAGYSVFFFPNIVDDSSVLGGYARGENISKIKCVFIDHDTRKSLYASDEEFLSFVAKFKHKPMLIVFSGGGYHVYWCITGCPVYRFESLQKRLSSYFKTDSAICDLPRVMRLPYTVNPKYNKLCRVVQYNGERKYSYEDFDAALPKLPKGRPKARSIKSFNPDSKPISTELPLIFKRLSQGFPRLLELLNAKRGVVSKNTKSKDKTCSHNDYELVAILDEAGLSIEEMSSVLINSYKSKQIRHHTRRVRYVQRTIDDVLADGKYKYLYSKIMG